MKNKLSKHGRSNTSCFCSLVNEVYQTGLRGLNFNQNLLTLNITSLRECEESVKRVKCQMSQSWKRCNNLTAEYLSNPRTRPSSSIFY